MTLADAIYQADLINAADLFSAEIRNGANVADAIRQLAQRLEDATERHEYLQIDYHMRYYLAQMEKHQ